MILLPAIDIRGGRAVRLQRGDFDKETVYVDDPLEAARSFVEAGATFLHVVDLDGAREGKPVNLEHLRRITTELGVAVQYGGGLRDLGAVRSALQAGAERTAPRSRRPPPYCTATPSSLVIRRRWSRLTGFPSRAPSRSTTCRKPAPASTNERAASSGSST